MNLLVNLLNSLSSRCLCLKFTENRSACTNDKRLLLDCCWHFVNSQFDNQMFCITY